MLSVQPQLSNAQILAGLKQTARPHPSGTFCAVNTGICGAGLLDTAGAVGYAQNTAPAGAGSGTTGSGDRPGVLAAVAVVPFRWPVPPCCWRLAWPVVAVA